MGAVANTNLSFGVAEILSLISIVLSAVFTMVSLILFFIYDRKLKRLQEKELVFKYSPYPYINGLYINPKTKQRADELHLPYRQIVSESDLDSIDKNWIEHTPKIFEYRVFMGVRGFVWKPTDLKEKGYRVICRANTIVLRNLGERMVSAKVLEVRKFDSFEDKTPNNICKGAGTIHRILERDGKYSEWKIPITLITYGDGGDCEDSKPHIGSNLLEKSSQERISDWQLLEIDLEVQNIMGDAKKYTLRLIYADQEIYSETIPPKLKN